MTSVAFSSVVKGKKELTAEALKDLFVSINLETASVRQNVPVEWEVGLVPEGVTIDQLANVDYVVIATENSHHASIMIMKRVGIDFANPKLSKYELTHIFTVISYTSSYSLTPDQLRDMIYSNLLILVGNQGQPTT